MRRTSRLLTRRDGVLRAAVAPALESLECRTLLSSISLANGVLTVAGTPGNDVISFALKSSDSSALVVTCNSRSGEFSLSSVTQIQAFGGRGNDSISAVGLSTPVAFYGGAGNDILVGGSGGDTLSGDGGNDVIIGNAGNNILLGSSGIDRILGGVGNDTIRGGGGHDIINGGGGADIISSDNPADVNAGAGTVYQSPYRSASTPGATPLVAFQFGAVGLVPSQIRVAYDIRYKALGGVRGQGQTIYIVDAFTGNNVLGDLNIFSAQFGLPQMNSSNFQQVYANAEGLPPAVDPLWASEIALDVEWAHAIAPQARIVLVQADTNLSPDLLRATQTAAAMSEGSGGGVVSMSFTIMGETDPFAASFENVFKSSPRTTFVAGAGDTPGVSYPSTSPSVLSVGGTLLYVDPFGNRIAPETAWRLTGGGVSTVFTAPSYQSNLPYPMRATPDVAYNADPDSGVAVYNSTTIAGVAGWIPAGVGGTSAGAVQWAAIIALANGKRALSGQPTIGAHAVVDIYQIAQVDDPAAFNDIVSGGPIGQVATQGFDLSTGWGTPRATALIGDLATTNAPYLAAPIEWDAMMIQSSSVTITHLRVAMGGTGYASGGSRINLLFTPVPDKWDAIAPTADAVGLVANITAVDLYRSNPINGVSRVYGAGAVSFSKYRVIASVQTVPTGGPLKFEGSITVDAQGNEHISVKFWAVDAFGNPWPTSPFKLAQLDAQTGQSYVSFTGSFEG